MLFIEDSYTGMAGFASVKADEMFLVNGGSGSSIYVPDLGPTMISQKDRDTVTQVVTFIVNQVVAFFHWLFG